MRFKKIIVSIMALPCFLTGCYPTGEFKYPRPQKNNSSVEISSENGETKNFTMDAEIPDEYPDKLPIIRIKTKDFDYEKTAEYFCFDKTLSYTDSKEDADGTPGYRTYFYDDGTVLSFQCKGSFIYDTSNKSAINSLKTNMYYDQNLKPDKYIALNTPNALFELENFSKAEALAVTDKIISDLGIKYLGEPVIYSVSKADMDMRIEEERKRIEEFGGTAEEYPEFTEDEEFYYIYYLTEFSGFPAALSSYPIFAGTNSNWNSMADFIISKNELIRCSLSGICEEMTEVSEVQIKCSPGEAKKNVSEYYSSKLIDKPITINDCGLVYGSAEHDYIGGIYTYAPVWEFTGYQDFSEPDKTVSYNCVRNYIDPKTGTVLQCY